MRAATILVVEDDPIARNLIVQALSGRGFRVFEADTAAEALAVANALEGQGPDLVITDHSLSQAGGQAAAERIFASFSNAKVLQTANAAYQQMSDGNQLIAGAAFLQKPFTAAQLLEVVQNILTPRTH